jgi:hypothetical protein
MNSSPEFLTRDSGKREDYPTGMRRDTQEGKSRFDLVMPLHVPYECQMLTRWANLMARGREKYGERNWELAATPEEYARFKGSALRHLLQWYHGVDDGEDHAAAVLFNIQAAEYVKTKLG